MTPPDLPPAPLPPHLLEAAIYCDDLDRAEAFYGDVLGLPRIQRVGDRHVFFRVGTGTLLVFNPHETAKPPGNPRMPVPPHGAHGPGHVCFAMPAEAIARWRDRLTAAGIDIETEFAWPNGAQSLYFRDPCGNSIEFAEPWLWDDG
ncbi:glyoxalase/bleomycin resistance/extradiol dioxygenase family protein [Thalassococcus profundi]|uniref:Glyoxalase/bleomycin resistance/extradiol dioxygenase family protein n=1 Tax=Thalassococcus profundi TaxID=2282382 RepID=A0A369TSM8_9RHOB|nr:VOC family protein [Thalassococcus profundi]RDD67435.1 glyoxalase/bleomycin resistance/extradiol dioxygenase family protein [Thalassococcus profundi]